MNFTDITLPQKNLNNDMQLEASKAQGEASVFTSALASNSLESSLLHVKLLQKTGDINADQQ